MQRERLFPSVRSYAMIKILSLFRYLCFFISTACAETPVSWGGSACGPGRRVPASAFLILGCRLENCAMTEDLIGRCGAAAATARAFPDSVLVCSGGAAGRSSPEKHTEAGMMKAYLAEECGIDPDRIFTDDRAMTTAENAINTLAILRKQGIETVTIVTSAYHQKWGQVLYNAMAAVYEIRYGYPVSILGNFCYNIGAEDEAYQHDDRIAIRQLSQILNLPKGAVQMDPRGK